MAPAMSSVRVSSALAEGGAETELGRAATPVPFHQVVPLSAINVYTVRKYSPTDASSARLPAPGSGTDGCVIHISYGKQGLFRGQFGGERIPEAEQYTARMLLDQSYLLGGEFRKPSADSAIAHESTLD